MMLAYQVTCRVNGKSYIGITSRGDLRRRWNEHRRDAARRPRMPLHHAINKYGAENFEIEPVATMVLGATFVELAALEAHLIVDRGVRTPAGYNATDGGEGTPGYRHTAEERARRSASNDGGRAWKGKSHDPEALDLIAAASRKHWQSPEYREKHARGMKRWGFKYTPEQRQAISDRQRGPLNHAWGKKLSAEAIEKRRQAMLGHPTSTTTREKIGAAHRMVWAAMSVEESARRIQKMTEARRFARGDRLRTQAMAHVSHLLQEAA